MNKNLAIPFLGVLSLFLVISCVKDTDFDQANDVVLAPVIELDLIYFDLAAGDFYDTSTATSILTLRDTTNLPFLDDEEISSSLKRAEFYFKFTNSVARSFLVDFQFLSVENDTTYMTQTEVAQGIVSNPVITEFTENVEGASIQDLTMASKLVISVTIPSSKADLTGTLNLQSKTTYYLEFN
jgi:hypothetical protein